jgi:putative heme-binding domain-containing protein
MNARRVLVMLHIVLATGSLFADPPANLRDENLVAWCIVPFDAKNRGPAERAQMLKRLGLRRVAYDWRAQHVPTFEEEILQYQTHGIEYFAFWGSHEAAFQLFEKHRLHPQVWQTLGSPDAATQDERVEAAAKQMLPLAERTKTLGCKLGLYNHGGWGGEPQNLVAVCRRLRELGHAHVGIVYNQHHAHDHIDDFAQSLAAMKPYLLCLNLNGMLRDGERKGQKILPLGAGDEDLRLLKVIRDSGYDGPIGIIGHTQDDVELRLRDNLDGLHWLLPQLDGRPPGPRPEYRTFSLKKAANDGAPAIPVAAAVGAAPEYSPQLIAQLLDRCRTQGDPQRGLAVFASAKTACVSCHRVGKHGGCVGPDLIEVAKQRKPEELVESVLWPKRQVKPEYAAHLVVDSAGRSHQGYIVRRDDRHLVLRDPTKPDAAVITLSRDDIEAEREVGTLMPDNLVASLTQEQLGDLLKFVTTLSDGGLPLGEMDAFLTHATAHLHGPASFPFDRGPLHPEHWPHWRHRVNRDRLYDFYAKEADYFRAQSVVPPLLPDYPGIDGGALGHWGNQNDEVWTDGRWNDTRLGSVQCGVFRGAGKTTPRGVCVRVGELSACFNPDTLNYDAEWAGGFVTFAAQRHGFLGGVQMAGRALPTPKSAPPNQPFRYRGFYRHGEQVVFAYRLGEEEWLDVPQVKDGRFERTAGAADSHPLRHLLNDAPSQWPEVFETPIEFGTGRPYAVDTIGLPFDNPWKALLFCGGHAFLPDGSALVCTMQGDVWRVSEFAYPSRSARWRRFASGLHFPLGIVADKDGVFVLGRDQITRLHDLNHDGEADFYECFSNAYETSPAGHDFICGLERDAAGNFYTASGNQGPVRISADGLRAEVLATGFRNPDGLGLLPDGTVTVPCSEGEWTPASMICAVRPRGASQPLHFGYRGPLNGRPPELPLAYLPRGLDNSSGGQTVVDSEKWGPLTGQLLHFSFGMGAQFLVLRDEVEGQLQGAVVPLPGEFRSGVHRGRFHPQDGQLYVTGMQGWGCYTPDDGCFQRVRYTGEPVQLPVGFHVHENGVALTFSEALDAAVAAQAKNHFAQCWNYRYGPGYGSPEFSTQHFGIRGHDALAIQSAYVLSDGRTLFLAVPDLQPVNQLHLRVQSAAGQFHDLFVTVHKLDRPFTNLPDYRPVRKVVQPHPIHADLALAERSVPNPHQKKINGARAIRIETAGNLSFATRSFRVRAGEPIALTLSNPDVVPHNWALVNPGTLDQVGDLANRLIADPDAALRHYIPDTLDVLAYTDVVLPRDDCTIYFRAPREPGRYPYLCTFPGHWKVMNGEMVVE